MITAEFDTPIGTLLAAANTDGLAFLEFTEPERQERQLAILQKVFGCSFCSGWNLHLEKLQNELELYFARKLTHFSVPLLYPGTSFQQKVWNELLQIPYGETRSYADLARNIGVPAGVRAVGHANGQNRICIVIPCHRVINKGGKLGGYGGGLWRKEFLLHLEGASAPKELLLR